MPQHYVWLMKRGDCVLQFFMVNTRAEGAFDYMRAKRIDQTCRCMRVILGNDQISVIACGPEIIWNCGGSPNIAGTPRPSGM